MLNNPVGGQFRSKLGEDFTTDNGAKILGMAYPQNLGQKYDPTSSKFHIRSCRIAEERIQHERQGMEAQRQSNQTTQQLNANFRHACGLACPHFENGPADLLLSEVRFAIGQVSE